MTSVRFPAHNSLWITSGRIKRTPAVHVALLVVSKCSPLADKVVYKRRISFRKNLGCGLCEQNHFRFELFLTAGLMQLLYA